MAIFWRAPDESRAASAAASAFAARATRPRCGALTVTWINGVCPSFGTLPCTAVTDVPERIFPTDIPVFAATRWITDSDVTIARAVDGFVFSD